MKTLITGFKPFLDHKINPTEEILKNIKEDNIIKELLDVTYKEAFSKIEKHIDDVDLILLFGLAAGTKKVRIEKVAINLIDANHKDNNGVTHCNKSIEENGEIAYFSNANENMIINTLNNNGIDTLKSYSAGAYVCNYIYYKTLHHIHKTNSKTQALFIHVPCSDLMENDYHKMKQSILNEIPRIIINIVKEA